MPQVEVDVDEALVRRLLRGLPPHWQPKIGGARDAPVEHVATGWDNSVWRVGTGQEYAARIPVRGVAAPMVLTAARWVAVMTAPARAAGFRLPVPLHVAESGGLLPWPWLLVEWVPGTVVTSVPIARRDAVGEGLAVALPLLHRPAPASAPVNPARGVPLAQRRVLIERFLPAAREHLGTEVVHALLGLLDVAVAAPAWPRDPVWCHGDLHAANLALDLAPDLAPHPDRGHALGRHHARLGLLDFDDLTSGDPAVDLGALWLVLDADQRARARGTLEASAAYDEHVWTRARGWAVAAFVLPVAADPAGRHVFADELDHALGQLGCR